ncbi:MAG: signal peptidase I [Clostridiales Family XIII bacterium]|jgi:signal peptidase I|nr:signal peptidase I [Clostridiales Family XIII bacterium]
MTDKNASGARRFFAGGRRPYMLAIVAAIIVFILVAPVRVHGDNMSPLLNDGDVVIIAKRDYYDARLPQYGDVLCFKRSFAPEGAQAGSGGGSDERSYRFARVAGLPGDRMDIRPDGIYRNGEKLNGLAASGDAGEAAPKGEAASTGAPAQGDDSGIRKVGAGEVFVLNDDPRDALDSRDDRVDTLLSDARGRVVFRVWPFDGFGMVR